MSEGQEQGEAVAGIDLERAGLCVAQPALGDEIVKEGVKPLFADQRCGLPGKREGDSRTALGEIGFVVSEDAAATRLLPKFSGEAINVVDLPPKRLCHKICFIQTGNNCECIKRTLSNFSINRN